jgi:hypothetical protein
MTEPIILRFRLADLDETGISGRLQKRYYGPFPAILLAAVLLGSGTAAIFAVVVYLQYDLNAALAGVVAGGVAMMITLRANRFYAEKLQRAVLAAPFRHDEITVILRPDGAYRTESLLPWRWIVDVIEDEGVTLLLISPLEFLPLPHDRLQDGVTPDQMRAAIAEWRAAAA